MREIRCDKFIQLLEDLETIEPTILSALVGKHGQDHSGLMIDAIDKGIVRRDPIGEIWARAIGTTYVNPLSISITCEETRSIPIDMARKIKAIGLYKINDHITMAMEDPTNLQLIESLERLLQYRISPVYSHAEDIEHAIDLFYHADLSFDEALQKLEAYTASVKASADDREALTNLVEANALIDITNRILYSAFKQRASDIHIEPTRNAARIRLRIDGHLRPLAEVPTHIHRALMVRIKYMSELDIADTRMPQDGRFTLTIGSFEQNFRVSTCPGIEGEKAVLRILGLAGAKSLPTFDELHFSKTNLTRFRTALARPNGILITTGPTGSGKTTTLYSAIEYLNDDSRNIMTIENPVEYRIPGVNHFEVKHNINLDFSRFLRSALRQDPDIMLIGEIRDEETANIAAEAALTGHLVLTSLHTNSAAQAIIRLIEIGVDPHLVAPSLNAVMSQRLVGKICEHCKEAYQPKREVLQQFFTEESLSEAVTFYRGRGCKHCFKSGFKGRVALHEIIEVSESMRELIAYSAPLHSIVHEARRIGFSSLREDGLQKALLGLTTLDEVQRVTNAEFMN
ncbi:GspE/PulE family protein [Pelagicoccus sp. SDUM812003]|uniref:GspE/PulE family protein n=1 Tax=Pelagicoccus sp. SDUM812003 TaxID=3041267 RepID=UPI00280FCDA4|nr:GspE/PulE family protein [Pelagicoccus sp. SDUM812003]MDQ8202290.1 GspE/PulE family protein [Pelagicoccus sp. SDUM812003]